jgi:hypothetical protein
VPTTSIVTGGDVVLPAVVSTAATVGGATEAVVLTVPDVSFGLPVLVAASAAPVTLGGADASGVAPPHALTIVITARIAKVLERIVDIASSVSMEESLAVHGEILKSD